MANTPNLDLENVNVLLDTDYAYNQLVSEIIAKINNNNLKIDNLPNNFILSTQKGVANGVASLGNDGIIPKAQLPTDSGSVERVADITARDSIVNLYDNKLVFVIDASADLTVTSGWAMYIYSSASLSWTKIVDGESLDIQLTWDNISNKPTAFPPETHTHAQIDINAQNITDLQNNKVDKVLDSRLVSETEIAVFNDKYSKIEVDNKLSMLETNIDWKESVNTFADIATTYPSPVDGWTVNVKDTDYTYRYSGTAWVAISANAIPKATTSVDGLMPKEYVAQVDTNKTDILSAKTTLGSVAMTTTTQTVTGAINELDADIGNKATLTTTDKTNLVNAVNETKAQINTLDADNVRKFGIISDGVTNQTTALVDLFSGLNPATRGVYRIPYNTLFDIETVYSSIPIGVMVIDESLINNYNTGGYKQKYIIFGSHDRQDDDGGVMLISKHHPNLVLNNLGGATNADGVTPSTSGAEFASSMLFANGLDSNGSPITNFRLQSKVSSSAFLFRIAIARYFSDLTTIVDDTLFQVNEYGQFGFNSAIQSGISLSVREQGKIGAKETSTISLFENTQNNSLSRLQLSCKNSGGTVVRKYLDCNNNGSFIIRSTNASAILTVTDNGNGQFSNGVSGGAFTTTNRPTGVAVGTMVFDTTLGKPIWLKTAPNTWVDATGTTV